MALHGILHLKRRALLVTTCLTLLPFAQTARAQSAEGARSGGEEEIVVTAERRETTVRKTGFSIVAATGEQLRTQQITSPANLTTLVPGMTLNIEDKTIAILTIRGSASTFRAASLDAPIAFFVDDIYYPYTTDFNANFYDLSRIEILRGPQGTLFGRNVVGGAIVVKTNNPVFDRKYLLSASGGNGGYFRTEGMVNESLVDNVLAARIAFSTQRQSGLIDLPNQSGHFNQNESYSVRGKLLWTPSEDLEVLLTADYNHFKGNGNNNQIMAFALDGGAPVIPDTFTGFSNDRWTSSDPHPSPAKLIQKGLALTINWDMLDGTLTSISSARQTETHSLNNLTALPQIAWGLDGGVNNKWYTQELRYVSAPSAFSYVVGGFFMHGKFNSIFDLTYEPLAGSPLLPLFDLHPTIVQRDQLSKLTSFAVFGEATYKFTEGFSLTVGARYSHDKKGVDFRASSPTNDPTGTTQGPVLGYDGPIHARGSQSWGRFTPRVTLKYDLTDSIATYLTYSKGFKSGGFVDSSYSVVGATTPLAPEDSTNLEGGIKSLLFDRRMTLNATVFRQTTKNLQNFSSTSGLPHAYNGSSRVTGLELESAVRLLDDFRVTFNYTYMDAK